MNNTDSRVDKDSKANISIDNKDNSTFKLGIYLWNQAKVQLKMKQKGDLTQNLMNLRNDIENFLDPYMFSKTY